uniref:Gfo/Idh/MocA-like oxidoreductase N-terminal domain-containing protein n=1 Tax=Arcella intermedia TaxID=1963864 RepID=A0A6B2L5E4_9EUKA
MIIGTGEYVSGIVLGSSSGSDKKLGVVALVLFDLRRRGFIDKILLAGTQGNKFPTIREHFRKNITGVYKDMDTTFESFPEDNVEREPNAYKRALDKLKKGDLVFIFTPDNVHFEMAKEAISRGLHVMVTKPIVQKLEDHLTLLNLAKQNDSLVAIEVHKRFDPIYSDCCQRIKSCGNFSYFSSYMSQPKFQLHTFKAWASFSDISYYLNSHHVDFHCWAMEDIARPESVYATASSGIANRAPYELNTEDTITLLVRWRNIKDPSATGTAVYTASWVAPKADVHSQQYFHYMGSSAEFRIDQAHRGYLMNSDDSAPLSLNPLYMKYTPDNDGYFSGQNGYGYKSIEEFVKCASKLRTAEVKSPNSFDHLLATVHKTAISTAILHAGRMSLDCGKPITIQYQEDGIPTQLSPQ